MNEQHDSSHTSTGLTALVSDERLVLDMSAMIEHACSCTLKGAVNDLNRTRVEAQNEQGEPVMVSFLRWLFTIEWIVKSTRAKAVRVAACTTSQSFSTLASRTTAER
jgi:hypothetical protein